MDDAQRQRMLKTALKAFVARAGSQHGAADALGYTQARLSQIISDDLPISMRLANALASAEGTTIDGLAQPDRAAAPREHVTRPATQGTPTSPPVELVAGAAPRVLADAIGAALDPQRGHTYQDGRAVEVALGEAFRFEDGADAVAAVRTWLDAARNIRRRGAAVTSAALLQEVTFGKTARAREVGAERDDAVNAEASDEADALGLVRHAAPGAKASDRPVEGTESMPSETTSRDGSGVHGKEKSERLIEHARRVAKGLGR